MTAEQILTMIAGVYVTAIIGSLSTTVFLHRLKERARRKNRPTREHCARTIAIGANHHKATCILRAGHPGECATTRTAFETIGYTLAPF